MSVLSNAIKAAEARKEAIGLSEFHGGTIQFSKGEQEDRSAFSGFDIDYDELVEVVETAGSFFTMQACGELPLIPLFRACWADAFLVGLMVSKSVAPHHGPPDPPNGSGGTNPRRTEQ